MGCLQRDFTFLELLLPVEEGFCPDVRKWVDHLPYGMLNISSGVGYVVWNMDLQAALWSLDILPTTGHVQERLG